jgi:hypothetical protein
MAKSSIFAVVFSLVLATASAHADNRVTIGGISVTGGAMQLIGTASTTSADDKSKALNVVGWGLIIVGCLVQSGDFAAGAEVQIPQAEMQRQVQTDARATLKNPAATSQRGISFAVNAFETKENMSYDAKAKLFSSVVLEVDSIAKDIKRNNAQGNVNVASLAKTILKDNATPKNVKIVTNLFALADVI